MVPTAISHKNTSATSTCGRRGEYNCTDTLRASEHANTQDTKLGQVSKCKLFYLNLPVAKESMIN